MEVIIGLSTNNSTWVQAEQSGFIFRFFFFSGIVPTRVIWSNFLKYIILIILTMHYLNNMFNPNI